MSSGVQYTRERLAEAAKQCSDIDEVIAFFGTQPYGNLRCHLFRRFDHFGIDVSHMPRRRRGKAPHRPTADELRHAVEGTTSVAGALRALGLEPYNGPLRARFRQWVTQDGLDVSHFLGQAHQRGKPGVTPVRRAEDILVRHDGRRRTRTHLLRRALREVGVPEVCAECGVGPEWRGKPMTLEVDHINGDWSDDRQANLRLLCPNCHAATSTWCRGGRRRHTLPR
ncbi:MULTISPECIES: HNH endonuclease [unclassified Streptomyces]|uniref:HNH endonuclease signature motif containing protein n=1 Tax=unclassified Streptomyces TaxID=2593676 RepID=UPI0011A39A1B|nr:HNH endonuclease [Streptomyces sp. BK340]TVZ89403.1 HNH endonuclease [Streptomyces sp. BK340]